MKKFVFWIYQCTAKGFRFLSLLLLKGIYFYCYLFLLFFKSIFRKSEKIDSMIDSIQQKPRSPECSLLLVFIFVVAFTIVEITVLNTNKEVKLDIDNLSVESLRVEDVVKDKEEYDVIAPEVAASKKYNKSLFKHYGDMDFTSIDFNELKSVNDNVVGWLTVDGTNINYPIVQYTDNDYYLNHNINKKKDKTGWTFMDYRNNSLMTDNNTIFYGHNLLNNTSFGSISKVFTDNWFNTSSKKIVYRTENTLSTYEIFSVYYINAESYYLQTNLSGNGYNRFLNTLKSRSTYDFGVDVTVDDKIITLSTCTNDNTGRKVIHAKMVSQESY